MAPASWCGSAWQGCRSLGSRLVDQPGCDGSRILAAALARRATVGLAGGTSLKFYLRILGALLSAEDQYLLGLGTPLGRLPHKRTPVVAGPLSFVAPHPPRGPRDDREEA